MRRVGGPISLRSFTTFLDLITFPLRHPYRHQQDHLALRFTFISMSHRSSLDTRPFGPTTFLAFGTLDSVSALIDTRYPSLLLMSSLVFYSIMEFLTLSLLSPSFLVVTNTICFMMRPSRMLLILLRHCILAFFRNIAPQSWKPLILFSIYALNLSFFSPSFFTSFFTALNFP